MWDIMEHISGRDCPAAVDALFFMYLAFCVLGSFLMALSVSWLCGYKYLSLTHGTVVPENYGKTIGMMTGKQPPVANTVTIKPPPPV